MNALDTKETQKLSVTAKTAERAAGRVWTAQAGEFFGNTYKFDVTFDAMLGKIMADGSVIFTE